MRRLLYLIAAVAVLAVPSTAPAQSGTIAFEQHTFDDSSFDLWLAKADGTSGAVRLTGPQSAPDPDGCFDICLAEAPDWSPDDRVFFDSSWAPFIHIWSIKPDGTDARQETFSAGFDGFPSVSPGGGMVAFEYDDPDDFSLGGIYVAPIGGGDRIQLSVSPKRGFDANPDISPDGTQVVFQRLRFNECAQPKGCGLRGETGFTSQVMVVGTDGSGLHKVLPGGQVWGDPHFSPDGSRILASTYWENKGRSRGTGSSLYTARPDGSDLTQLTSHKNEVSFASDWSPDGSRIVFTHYQFGDDHFQIRTIAADGSDPQTVVDCDPEMFCTNSSWGDYDGPLAAATIARARASVTASAAGSRAHRARRFRRAIRRELRGRSRAGSSRALRRGL